MFQQKIFGVLFAVLNLSFLGCGMLDRNGPEREVDIVVDERLREEGIYDQVVVLVAGDILGDTVTEQVEDIFTMEMLRKGYRVADRSIMDDGLSGAYASLDMVVRVSDGQISGWTGRIVDRETHDLLLMLRLGRGAGVSVSEASLTDDTLGGGRGTTLSPQTESVLVDEARMIIKKMPPPPKRTE